MIIVNVKKGIDTKALAMDITGDSELFGDEVLSVEAHLNTLIQEADKLGCVMSDTINDFYGGTVKVVAYPSHARHSWSF
jgi:hypothetical protein